MTESRGIEHLIAEQHEATLDTVLACLDLEAGLADITAETRQSELLLDEVHPLLDLTAGLSDILAESDTGDHHADVALEGDTAAEPSPRSTYPDYQLSYHVADATLLVSVLRSIEMTIEEVDLCIRPPRTDKSRTNNEHFQHAIAILESLGNNLAARTISLPEAQSLINEACLQIKAGESRFTRSLLSNVIHRLEKLQPQLLRLFDCSDEHVVEFPR